MLFSRPANSRVKIRSVTVGRRNLFIHGQKNAIITRYTTVNCVHIIQAKPM